MRVPKLSPQDEHLAWEITGAPSGYPRIGDAPIHRLIMNAQPGEFVDHINGDTWDCRRENLRLCTHQQNMQNRKVHSHSKTGVKGVCWDGKTFRARIRINGKQVWLGRSPTVEGAAALYNAAALEHFGEFARVT